MTVKLHLPFPLSVNAMYKNVGKRRAPSKRYKDWKVAAGWTLAEQWRGKCIDTPLMVTIIMQQPDKRRRDLDNLAKSILDLLTGVVFTDDSQIKLLCLAWDWSDSPVGTRVLIDQMQGEIASNFLRTFAERAIDKSVETDASTSASTDQKPTFNGG